MSKKKFIPANQGQGWFSQESIAQQQQMLSNIPGHVELSNRLLLEKEQQNALAKELERLNQENLLAEKNNEAVKEQEKQLAQQEKEAKEAPTNAIEAEVKKQLGPEYSAYKSEKEKFKSLNDMTFSGMTKYLYNEYKKGDEKEIKETDNWFERNYKRVRNLGNEVGAGLSSFAVAAVGKGISQFGKEGTNMNMTSEQERQHAELSKKINAIEKPILLNQQKEIQENQKIFNDKYAPIEEQLRAEHDKLFEIANNFDSSKSFAENNKIQGEALKRVKEIVHELDRIGHVRENYDMSVSNYQDAIDNAGFWGGLGRDLKSTLTLGITDLDNSKQLTEIISKAKEIEKTKQGSLTDLEKNLLESQIIKQGTQGVNTNTNYELGDSVRQSAMFMAEMAIVSRLTGGFGGTAMKFLEGSSKLTRASVGLAEEMGKTLIHPSMYNKGSEAFANPLQSVESFDESGEVSGKEFVLTDAKKLSLSKDYQKKLSTANNLISKKEKEAEEYFDANGEINQDIQKELSELYAKKGKVENAVNSLVDEDGKVIRKELDKTDALIKGFQQTLVERLAEKYVGHYADKSFGKIGKTVADTKVGKYVANSKVGQVANWANKQVVKGRRFADDKFFDSTKAGALSKVFSQHTGPAKMMHSLPSEMAEEIMVQMAPVYREDYGKQMEELLDPSFYKQVALSTLIIGGGTSSVGLATHGFNYATNEEYKKEYDRNTLEKQEIKQLYRRLDEAVTDDQVANDIAMNTLGTFYSINDYQKRINDLRNEDFEDKEGKTQEERNALADKLEKASFFNMAYQAMNTGTQSEFRNALNSVSRNKSLSEETRKSAELAKTKLDKLNEQFKAHRDKVNFPEIYQNIIQKDILETTIAEHESELEKARQNDNLISDLDTIRAKNNFDFNVDLETVSLEDAMSNPAINNQLAIFSNESSALKKFIDQSLIVNSLKNEVKGIDKNLEYELNPDNAKEIRQRYLDRLTNQIVENTNDENVQDNKDSLSQQEPLTAEQVSALNEAAVDNIIPFDNSVQEIETTEEIESPEQNKHNIPDDLTDQIYQQRLDEIEDSLMYDEDLSSNEVEKLKREKDSIFTYFKNKTTTSEERKEDNKRKKNQEKIDSSLEEQASVLEDLFTDEEGVKFDAGTNQENRETLNFGEQSADEKAAEEAMDDGLFAPIPFDSVDKAQREYINKMKDVFNNMKKKGISPDFSGIIAGIRSRVNNDRNVEQKYNFIAVAYQEAFNQNLSEEDLISTYENNFGTDDLNAFGELLGGETFSNTEAINSLPSTDNQISTEENVTEDNKEIDPVTNQEIEKKYAPGSERLFKGDGTQLKLGGVLGIDYEETEDGKKSITNKVNETALPFIDWRNLRPGSQVEFTFDIDYLLTPGNVLSIWENTEALNLDGKDRPIRVPVNAQTRLLEIFKGDPNLDTWDKIKQALEDYKLTKDLNNPLFNNEEFLKIVPVGTVNNDLTDSVDETGTPISSSQVIMGGLNDYYWFNNNNVALRVTSSGELMLSERENRIQANRKLNLEARKAILANGSLTVTVNEKTDKADNKRTKQDAEENFYSITSQITEDIEEFKKHATVAIFKDNSFVSSITSSGKTSVATINGKVVTEDKIVNFKEFKQSLIDSGFLFQPVFIHQSGINEKGEPIYTARQITSNHKNKQTEFENTRKILRILQSELFGTGKNVRSIEEQKKLQEAFKNAYGISVNTKELFNKLSALYPSQNKSGEYRQDLSLHGMSSKALEKIPDLSSYSSYDQFVQDLIEGNPMPKIGREEMVYGNLHTNLIFTPITKNGETIYTEQSQPYAMFDFKSSSERKTTSEKQTQINHNERLETVKNNLKEQIAKASTEEQKQILKDELKGVETQIQKNNIEKKQEEQSSVTSLPGTVQENNEFLQNLAEQLGVSNLAEAKDLFEKSMENFVNSHIDMLVDNFDAEGHIKKECK